jgi:hypothetical protein
MRTTDPMLISPLELDGMLKKTLHVSKDDIVEFLGWMEACTDEPFTMEVGQQVTDIVMELLATVVMKSHAVLLGSLLSDTDKATFTTEMEEYKSIAELLSNVEEETDN